MAHMVENMMYVGERPWHGLGENIDDSASLDIHKAIKAAGLDWEVGLKPIYTETPSKGNYHKIPEYYSTYRKTDDTVLGLVGAKYHPLQNIEAFEWFQPFLEAKHAHLETAGSLIRGKRIWVLAKLNNEPLVIRGDDVVSSYILLSNSHDGSQSVRVGFTPIRVVCYNTLSMAHESEASKLIRIRHTQSIKETLNLVRDVMDIVNKEFEATLEEYKKLASKDINSNDLKKYIRLVFDLPETGGKKLIPEIVSLFEGGRGYDMDPGTYWKAYNAVTEYLNHVRGNQQETRINSLWFGEGAEINRKALRVGLEMASK